MRKDLWGIGLATAAALVMTVGVASARPWDRGDGAHRQPPTPRPAIVRSVSVPEAVRPVRGSEAVRPVSVPEIDARSGLAALAAVCAALALAWERRRTA